MVITAVRIFLNERTPSNLRGIAHVILNNGIILRHIHIIGTENDAEPLKVVYPVYHLQEQGIRRCFYPSNKKSRKKYDTAIITAYNQVYANPSNNTVVFVKDEPIPDYVITETSIYPHDNQNNRTLAKVNIELDNELWLRGMYLMRRENGSLYLQMPRRRHDNQTYNLFHPCTQESRDTLTNAVMPLYQAVAAQSVSA